MPPPSPARSVRAAWAPWSRALSQCSTRITCPNVRFGQRATSPAATTPGAARHVSSQTTPSSRVRPEPSSHPVTGVTPTPDHHDVGVDRTAVVELDPLDPGAAGQAGHPDTGAHVDPVVAVEVGGGAADHLAEHSGQRGGERLDHA